MNVVDDKQTDSTSENICMNIDMSINDDECIILYTCTKSMCNILSICHNSVSSLMLMRQYSNMEKLIKSIKKCQQTDEIYANRYNYEYNNNYLCLYTTCTIKNKCELLRDVCEQEKLLVNMKIQYQFKYRKMFKNISISISIHVLTCTGSVKSETFIF